MSEVVAKPRSSAVVVPNATRWHQRIAAWIIYLLVKTVSLTLRYRWSDRSGYFDGPPPGPAVYCVWHNRLALSMIAYFSYIKRHNQTEGLAAMVSASRDGGFLAGILECFGVQPVRGSTSRRGPQALRELTSWAKRGYDVAITPDGPRGPCFRVQDGVIALAQLTELPLIPVSYRLGWKITVKSWDRFQVPLPFSRCEMIYEKPIRVPRNATGTERESFRLQLEQVLREISGESPAPLNREKEASPISGGKWAGNGPPAA
jgi:lysophospholipid acyltransferase (LPLAT)-like uncharacterized protein